MGHDNINTIKPGNKLDLVQFIGIMVILVGASFISYIWEIELSLGLPKVMILSTIFFGLIQLVPNKYRRAVIPLFSVIGSLLFLNWIHAFLLFFIGIVIIEILSYINNNRFRLLFIVFIVFTLIIIKLGSNIFAGSSVAFSVLSIFIMFKLFYFNHELESGKGKGDFLDRANYFFMLPNFVFYIFPLFDYSDIKRKENTVDLQEVYKRGAVFIAIGVLDFLLYRILYQYYLPDRLELVGFLDLTQYLTINYLLILRLIGIFYWSVGIMCLFGFDCKRPFNFMFLSTGFGDLWRRLNVYWKDFVMKTLYYPLYFRVRKFAIQPLIGTIVGIFILSWLLHNYQWFWILGEVSFRLNDLIFWLVFGVLVAASTYFLRVDTGNTNIKKWLNSKSVFIRGGQAVMMFVFMCLIYAFWTSSNIQEFITMFLSVDYLLLDMLACFIGLLILYGLAVLIFLLSEVEWSKYLLPQLSGNVSYVLCICSFLFVLLSFSFSVPEKLTATYSSLDERVFSETLNDADQEQQFEGYYEELMVKKSGLGNLNDVDLFKEEKMDDGWGRLGTTGIGEEVDDISFKRLKPNQSLVFKGSRMTTNEHGLRDRMGYSLEKPDSTYRIILLGGSIEMGVGVGDKETFENVVEDALNSNPPQDFGYSHIEILNMGISGQHIVNHVGVCKSAVERFNPNCVIYMAHANEQKRALKSFYKALSLRSVAGYPFLDSIKSSFDVVHRPKGEVLDNLELIKDDIWDWGMGEIAEIGRDRELDLLWVYLPGLSNRKISEFNELSTRAQKLGYRVVDLSDVFKGISRNQFKISVNDEHPNVEGHKRIADFLELRMREVLLFGEDLKR